MNNHDPFVKQRVLYPHSLQHQKALSKQLSSTLESVFKMEPPWAGHCHTMHGLWAAEHVASNPAPEWGAVRGAAVGAQRCAKVTTPLSDRSSCLFQALFNGSVRAQACIGRHCPRRFHRILGSTRQIHLVTPMLQISSGEIVHFLPSLGKKTKSPLSLQQNIKVISLTRVPQQSIHQIKTVLQNTATEGWQHEEI